MNPNKKMTSSFVIVIVIAILLPLCSSFLIRGDPFGIRFRVPKVEKKVRKLEISANITGDQVVGNDVVINVNLKSTKEFDDVLLAELVCQGKNCIRILGDDRFGVKSFGKDSLDLQWKLKFKENGLANLMVELIEPENLKEIWQIDTAQSLIQLKVGKSYALATWATIVGYIYFVAWMLSLYPILISNFSRKSVVGLNLDFVALNTTGYLAYSIYNVTLFYSSDFQEAYYQTFPGSQIPVQFNDILFACHGFIVNVLICLQCIFYDRGDQMLTNTAKSLLIGIYSPALVLTLFYILDGVNRYYFISFFSYCKLMLTLFKYIPQAYFNYKRKSTEGFSIAYIFLDLTGGSFSIFQMLLNSINLDDFRNFTGNAGKVGLGLVSIAFDILFMTQHYLLYRHRKPEQMRRVSSQSQNNYGSGSSNEFYATSDKTAIANKGVTNDIPFDNRRDVSNGVQNEAFEN